MTVTIVSLLLGSILAYSGSQIVYDSQPIPTTPVQGPAPLLLTKDEPWRGTTSLRYMEQLKEEVATIEKAIEVQHQEATAAHAAIHKSSGRIEYDDHLSTISWSAAQIEILYPQLAPIKTRISRLFAGDVGFESRELDQDLKKKQRNKDELTRQLREWEAPCTIRHSSQGEIEDCEQRRAQNRTDLLVSIHESDLEIIEQESHIAELRDFDFKKLWRDLGLTGSPGLSEVDPDRIARAKANASVIVDIPPVGPPKPVVSEEEQKEQMRVRKAAIVDRRRKLKMEELGKILNGRTFDLLSPEEQEDFRQTEMMHDDAMRVAREDLSKYL